MTDEIEEEFLLLTPTDEGKGCLSNADRTPEIHFEQGLKTIDIDVFHSATCAPRGSCVVDQ